MTDEIGDIRQQVKERVEAEASGIEKPAGRQAIDSKLINECLFANELGDGRLFAELHRDRFLYCKSTQEWYEWTGHCWSLDKMNRALAAVEGVVDLYLREYSEASEEIAKLSKGEDETEGRIKKLQKKQEALLSRVRQLRGDKRRTACLKFSHTIDDPLAITGEELDGKPMLFPCANGVIDLETGRLMDGLPGDYLSLASPVPFLGIDSPAPIWERSIHEIFGGNLSRPPDAEENERARRVVDYIRRLFGYAMTGLVNEKLFPMLYGRTGWNGRSLIVETISYIMGDLAGSIPSEMLLSQRFSKSASGPSPDIMSLKGIRLAFASEIDEGQRFSMSKIKWLTGKDTLVGRNPHDKYQTHFSPTHKLFVMTNVQPQASPNDKAFWERLHMIPFTISFVNREPRESYERRAIIDLDRQVRDEASGILAWLVRGCLEYQKYGLAPPREVTEATEEYRRNEDLLADFVDECCVKEAGARAKASDLYARFVDWYHDNVGQKEPTGTWFGKMLAAKFTKDKSNGHVVYYGVALADLQ